MRYQLVLQFKGDSLADYNEINALENSLIKLLGGLAEVDGHDVGSGETNIFIFTSDPPGTFQQVRPMLEHMGYLQEVTAAFREADRDRYTVLWPEGSARDFGIV
jgi:hypothetical protein